MRTPTKRGLTSSHSYPNTSLLLALPFPACIFDPGSNIVFYSNTFFNNENSVQLIHLLDKWDYRFLSENDLKILNHRVKIENKISTRRIYYKDKQVKSVELHLSSLPGENLILFFFNEVWVQDTVLSKSTDIQGLMQFVSEGVVLIDENDSLTYCNTAFTSFFNRKEEQIIGENITTIVNPSNNVNLKTEIYNLHNLKEVHFEFQVKCNNEQDTYLLVHGVPRKTHNNNYSGAFLTFIDITDRVQLEQELLSAKERASEADKLKSTFLANISHEIRTPMNSIIGFSTMLKRNGLDKKKKDQYIEIINSRGKHLMEMLTNIIDVSKLEENLIELNSDECNLIELFDELKDYFSEELIKNNKGHIKLITNTDCELNKTTIISDGHRLNQILSNLLNNAIKFTEEGIIEAGFRYTGQNMLLFYVKDTGIGVPSDKQSIIFERFRQVDESFTRTYGGAGLGLSICKGLVKLMNGKIWVESDGINGSAFYFSIPVVNFVKGENKIEGGICMCEKIYDWRGKKILIIEDDTTSYEFLWELLQPTQCIVKHANNGTDALKSFHSENFDLILLDIQLPEMDGYQIAKTIRGSNPNIPIIAQTAHAMSDDKQKCLNAGCNDYLTKPVHFELLLDTINSYFLTN